MPGARKTAPAPRRAIITEAQRAAMRRDAQVLFAAHEILTRRGNPKLATAVGDAAVALKKGA